MLLSPEGAQAAQIDIEAAYRQIPVLPEHRKYLVISLPVSTSSGTSSVFFVDRSHPFGLRSAGGNLGMALDTTLSILKTLLGIEFIAKWVDDIIPTRIPTGRGPSGFIYSVSFDDIRQVLADLGWPLSATKILNFSTLIRYIGFDWDLAAKRVSLPEHKRLKFLLRVTSWLTGASTTGVTAVETDKLVGSLEHVANIFPHGRSFLPSLYGFRASFGESHRFVHRFPPASCITDAKTWLELLSIPNAYRQLHNRPQYDPDLWVDASSDWGVGLVVGRKWRSWKFRRGWKTNRRDIGWAETVAIEIAALHLASSGQHEAEFVVRSDNQGAIGATAKGRGRNAESNLSIRRTCMVTMLHGFDISVIYVPSAENRADEASRGINLYGSLRLDRLFELPAELALWLEEV